MEKSDFFLVFIQMTKKSAAELRAELKALRKEHVRPVSKMRVGDISAEIERLRVGREETPAVDAVPSAPPRKLKAAVESIKKAKAAEFPVAPASLDAKSGKATKKAAAPSEKKKITKMEKLMAMLEDMSDSDEE